MEVWEISMNIYLKFKMKLPLYDEYDSYKFLRKNNLSRKIIKTFSQNHLAIVMYTNTSDSKYEYFLFIYSFSNSQHSAMIMTQNITKLFENST